MFMKPEDLGKDVDEVGRRTREFLLKHKNNPGPRSSKQNHAQNLLQRDHDRAERQQRDEIATANEGVVDTPGNFEPGLPIPEPYHTKPGALQNKERMTRAANFSKAGKRDDLADKFMKKANDYENIHNSLDEEQLDELKGAPKTPEQWGEYARKAAQWRSAQPNDYSDPKKVDKANRRTEREMQARMLSKDKESTNEGKFTINAKTGAKLDPKTGAELPTQVSPVSKKRMFAPKVNPTTPKLTLDAVWRKVEDVVGQIYPDGDPIDWMAPWLEKQGIADYKIGDILERAARKNGYKDMYDYWKQLDDQMKADAAYDAGMAESEQMNEWPEPEQFDMKQKRAREEMAAKKKPSAEVAEGSMGGLNRCAPSNDVSYENVLNNVKDKWRGQVTKVDELDDNKLRHSVRGVQLPRSTEPGILRKAYQSSNILAKLDDREHNKKLDNIERERNAAAMIDLKESEYMERLQAFLAEAIDKEEFGKKFADILGKQQSEKPAAAPRVKTKDLPLSNKRFYMKYLPQTDMMRPLKWQIRSVDKDEIKYEGNSSDLKTAMNDAEKWLATSSSGQSASSNVTVNFNAAFAREFGADGATVYCAVWEGPMLVISSKPQKGLQKTSIRTPEHSRTSGAALLPATTISPKLANSVNLDGNSYYRLEDREMLDDETYAFKLEWLGKVEPGVTKSFKEPIIQTSSVSNIKESISFNRIGQPELKKQADEKYGVYVNGKLTKSFYGTPNARIKAEFERRFPGSKITFK